MHAASNSHDRAHKRYLRLSLKLSPVANLISQATFLSQFAWTTIFPNPPQVP